MPGQELARISQSFRFALFAPFAPSRSQSSDFQMALCVAGKRRIDFVVAHATSPIELGQAPGFEGKRHAATRRQALADMTGVKGRERESSVGKAGWWAHHPRGVSRETWRPRLPRPDSLP